jgi:tetratricopeptide (TPR) repeat protein
LKTVLLSLFCALSLCVFSIRPALAAPSKRELQGREAFAAGQYEQALTIFAELYAKSLHPTYLRNIGRCHQSLGNADKAIASFRDYLRKAKGLKAAEKKEVQGFIAEMEELKTKQETEQREREAQARKAAEVPALPPVPVKPAPTARDERDDTKIAPLPLMTGVSGAGAGSQALQFESTPSSAASTPSTPLYQNWWFWAALGVVAVAAGGTALVVGGAFSNDLCDSSKRTCIR